MTAYVDPQHFAVMTLYIYSQIDIAIVEICKIVPQNAWRVLATAAKKTIKTHF